LVEYTVYVIHRQFFIGVYEMSLSSFLQNKQVKKRFKQEFKTSSIRNKPPLLVPPKTHRFSLVGTAFDYLVRFYLQMIYPKAKKRNLIAEETLELARLGIEETLENDSLHLSTIPALSILFMSKNVVCELTGIEENLYEIQERMADINYPSERPLFPFLFKEYRLVKSIGSAYLRQMDDIIKQSKDCLQRNISKKTFKIKELAKCCLQLAQIDPILRAGRANPWLGVTDNNDIDDLCCLFKEFKKQKWIYGHKHVLLNPTFGSASQLVGGADADLILDNVLVDIKCTKKASFDRFVLNQLLGYYILSRISSIDNAPNNHRIKYISVYFARFGKLYQANAEEILPEENLSHVVKWFTELASKHKE
jgi:hypothetical protein